MGQSLKKRPPTLKIAAVGRKTALSLQKLDVIADFVPPEFVAESLIKHFPFKSSEVSILLPRVQTGGRSFLANAFLKAGLKVLEVPAYESSCPENIPEKTLEALNNEELNAIAFTSGKTVIHTVKLMKKYFGDDWKRKLLAAKIISIGPQTSLTCNRYLGKVDEEASPYDLIGLKTACIKALS